MITIEPGLLMASTQFEGGCVFHGCDRNRFMCDATSPFFMESYRGGYHVSITSPHHVRGHTIELSG